MIRLLPAGLWAVLAVVGCAPAQTAGPDRAARWEKDIAAIEKRLKQAPPARGGVAFAGSSSIRLWDLKKSFPDRNAVNLGFGGSQIPDSTRFAPRLILPLAPRAVEPIRYRPGGAYRGLSVLNGSGSVSSSSYQDQRSGAILQIRRTGRPSSSRW